MNIIIQDATRAIIEMDISELTKLKQVVSKIERTRAIWADTPVNVLQPAPRKELSHPAPARAAVGRPRKLKTKPAQPAAPNAKSGRHSWVDLATEAITAAAGPLSVAAIFSAIKDHGRCKRDAKAKYHLGVALASSKTLKRVGKGIYDVKDNPVPSSPATDSKACGNPSCGLQIPAEHKWCAECAATLNGLSTIDKLRKIDNWQRGQ